MSFEINNIVKVSVLSLIFSSSCSSISNKNLASFDVKDSRVVNEEYQTGLFPVKGESIIILVPPTTFLGKFFHSFSSHAKKNGFYHAIDIKASLGTEVLAYKGGVITGAEENFPDIGGSVKSMGEANYIVIIQDDGTEASYGHLMYNSVEVELGQRVSQGQMIAKVGNSGWSRTPHLHFQVSMPVPSKFETIPIKFYTSKGSNSWVPKINQRVGSKGPE